MENERNRVAVREGEFEELREEREGGFGVVWSQDALFAFWGSEAVSGGD